MLKFSYMVALLSVGIFLEAAVAADAPAVKSPSTGWLLCSAKCDCPATGVCTCPACDCATTPVSAGTEILYDNGYYPKPKEFGGKWISLPVTVVVIGKEYAYQAERCGRNGKPCLVCVRKGDLPPYDEFYLIRQDVKLNILKVGKGELQEVNSSVEPRYEPISTDVEQVAPVKQPESNPPVVPVVPFTPVTTGWRFTLSTIPDCAVWHKDCGLFYCPDTDDFFDPATGTRKFAVHTGLQSCDPLTGVCITIGGSWVSSGCASGSCGTAAFAGGITYTTTDGGSVDSTGRRTPIRSLFKRIFRRGSGRAGGCANGACGG
jgi:hypothetical protein